MKMYRYLIHDPNGNEVASIQAAEHVQHIWDAGYLRGVPDTDFETLDKLPENQVYTYSAVARGSAQSLRLLGWTGTNGESRNCVLAQS
jgi:hypothetical protein